MDTLAATPLEDATDSHSGSRIDQANSTRRPRLTLFVAQDSPHASAEWVDELRQFADCDIKTWQPHSAQDTHTDIGGTGFSRTLRLLDSVLSKAGAAVPGPAFVVFAGDAATAPVHQRTKSAPPRGGLAPGVKRRICELIDRDYSKALLLSDLAEIAKLSAYHFARAFKQSLGIPPHRYLLERRIAAAADLVRNSDRCLSDIALEVGFSDQSHFTRLFVRHMGETPRDFRRRHR
jgi:AraC-like DNA-binding protein